MRFWIDSDFQPDDLIALRCARHEPGIELVGVSRTGDGIDEHALGSVDVLLAIGPLTNVADTLDRAELPPRVVVMGGAIEPVAYRARERKIEHNFASDPAAAGSVLGRISTILVPLDATATILLPTATEDEFLAADAELRAAVTSWRDELRRAGGAEGDLAIGLHDPIALLVALDALPVQTERMGLAVDEDGSVRRDAAAREHDVIRAIDTDAAIARIVTSFGRIRH